MHQQRIQNRIRALIEKYERLSPDQVGKYNEANTRKDFILPLFQILGWDIHNTKANEVLEEEKASGKRVDYAFKIDGITKFYLEAKKFSVNLEEEKWAQQAIWYAWHKSVPWVILQAKARTWRDSEKTKAGNLVKDLNSLFRRFDKDYNSKLFEPHFCEKLKVDDNIFVDVINELYKNQKGIRYNFADIDADVFGSIYEQYLGHIQQTNGKTKSKRKSQGIYYTPRYIVDYIVKNTLGQMLQERTPEEIRSIKILDPACGSGSFLIKAFEELISYWQAQQDKKIKYDYDPRLRQFEKSAKKQPLSSAAKMQLLRNNIYGVDLDKEAVEIAQLNLLIRILEGRKRLPNLYHQIAWGNSLISGTSNELKKYFGKNWKDKKPFNWKAEFQEVFNHGGFDIIIGNPPYVQSRNLNDEERHFYWNKYLTDTNHSDIYSFFIEKSIDFLKNRGILGFIIPSTWLQLPSFKSLRKKIFRDCKLLKILFFDEGTKIFDTAQVASLILILQKESNRKIIKENSINIFKGTNSQNVDLFNKRQQGAVGAERGFNIFLKPQAKNILNKILKHSVCLKIVCKVIGGIRTGDDKKFLKDKHRSEDDKKLLRGRNVSRYNLKWGGGYIWYKPRLMKVKQAAAPKESKFFESKEKLLVRMITGDTIIATYDDRGYYFLQDNIVLPKHKYDIKYLLAILNSKLSKFIVKNTASNIAITQSLLKNFPIYKIDFTDQKEKIKHDELVKLVDKILHFNQELQKLDPIMDERECKEKQKEIKEVDKMIDQKVYGLYGLMEREIKIIEEFFANQ